MGSVEQAPPVRVVRGRGWGERRGGAHTIARGPAKVAVVEPPVAPVKEQVLDHIEQAGPA